MKKLNLLLFAILITVAVMPQSVFSMAPQQQTGQPQDTAHFKYISPTLRKVKATGVLQTREGMQWILPDSTWSNNYRWVNITRPEEPSDTMNLESSLEENNNNFE